MKSQWFEHKEKVIVLRKQGLSYREIENLLSIPRSTLSHWLRNIELTDEQKLRLSKSYGNGLIKARVKASEWHKTQKETRLKTAKDEAEQILGNIEVDDNIVQLALAMLYLGEGSKNSTTSIGNSNPLILKFFLVVLTKKYMLKMQFIQVRRWAWGASDIAYFANQAFFKINNIPLHKKISKFLRLIEGHLSWSTAPLILLLAAYPIFFFHTSSPPPFGFLANELPQYASILQRIAMVGIIISLFLSMRALPPKPERYKRRRTFWMVIQWVYLPITSIGYSAFAAIYAQTRLALGRYLGFVVTEKATKGERVHVGELLK